MSKRLQVLLEPREFNELRRAAARHQMTTSAWVRQCLRQAGRAEPQGDAQRKVAVVRSAALHAFPTGDIDQMLSEIERGYADDVAG
jgi:hypothetical protein